MPEFNYKLDVMVRCTSIPEKEDIPEQASVEFRIDPELKLEGIQEVLTALAKAWPEMRALHKMKGKDSDGKDKSPGG